MRDHTLARDSHGGLHIVATDWASGELRLYSRDDAGEWPFVVAGQHAEGISLAIDTKDQLHLSWIDWQTNQLHHASGPAGGPFTTSDIPAGKLGNDTSIAVSRAGIVSISYDERECGDLHLARRRPGQDWTTEVVETRGQVGSDSSLVLDEAGCVHVAYGDSDAWDLKYATKCR